MQHLSVPIVYASKISTKKVLAPSCSKKSQNPLKPIKKNVSLVTLRLKVKIPSGRGQKVLINMLAIKRKGYECFH